MNDKGLSKALSLFLRHAPEKIKIELDSDGWTDVNVLICNLKEKTNFFGVTYGDIERVVKENNKQRFTLDGNRIKANQGHSIKGIDGFDKTAKEPPKYLYHGTITAHWDLGIKDKGLLPMTRNQVHLSPDVNTAIAVADRWKGKRLILVVDSKQMYEDDFEFYLSDNGVWLTEAVPVKYLI